MGADVKGGVNWRFRRGGRPRSGDLLWHLTLGPSPEKGMRVRLMVMCGCVSV
jgi:hypothetical protein